MKEYNYIINGSEYKVTINKIEGNEAQVEVNGTSYTVELPKAEKKEIPSPKKKMSQKNVSSQSFASVSSSPTTSSPASGTGIKAPLPGVILDVTVAVGDEVKKGQKLAVLEAMKMENVIESDRDGKVLDVKVQKGDSILEGTDIVIIG